MIDLRAILTEAGVLGVFVAGLLLARRLGRRWHPTEIITMVLMGLLFEIVTAREWTYHHIVLVVPVAEGVRISVLFPFAWAGIMMAATELGEAACRRLGARRHHGAHYLLLMGAWLLVGNTSETLFYNAGMFDYVHDDSTWFNFILGQTPPLPPWAIVLGYPVFFPPVSLFFEWMEHGLAGGRPLAVP